MTKLRLVAFVSVSCVFVAAAPLAACSDDTSVNPPTEAGTTDGSTPIDSGADTNVTDAPLDTADTDAGLKLDTYVETLSEHMCNSLARCCFGTPNPADGGLDGGGSFDREKCENLFLDLGFESSSVGHALIADGKVTLDQAKGADCLAKIDTLSCKLEGSSLQTIRTACFGALRGTVTNGQACGQSIECATGLFCNPTTPGTLPGTCAPLRAAGENCGMFTNAGEASNSIKAEEACSYRGSGTPGLRCDSYDFVADDYTDPTTWTCKPAVANGQPCNSTVWCASGICDPATFLCTSPTQYFNDFVCTSEIKNP